jgi:RNA-directed DNA polymerase
LAKEIKDNIYRPKPIKKVEIFSSDGKNWLFAIASTRDKIVQNAIRIILTPIFEPIFYNHSHGFRSNRSCHSALKEIQKKWPSITWLIEVGFMNAFGSCVGRESLPFVCL